MNLTLRFVLFLCLLACAGQAVAAPPTEDLTPEQAALADQGFAAKDRGDLEAAKGYFEAALAQGEHPFLRMYLGEVALDQGDCAAAQMHLHKGRHNLRWVWPTKDYIENRRQRSLHRLHTTCPAKVVLACAANVRARIGQREMPCGAEVVIDPGEYVIEATVGSGAALPRRIYALGGELTTLRLDPPDANHPLAHWVPTSEQPIPEQDPAAELHGQGQFLSIFLGTSGAVITGLSIWLLVIAYDGPDPTKNPDPSLTEEEQNDAELLYYRRVSYGWGFSVVGALMTVGGILLWPGFWEDDPETPGFSLAPDVFLTPFQGQALGGALTVEF